MILPILEYPDPQLMETSKPVTEINDDLRRLAADMAETMYNAEGIGLAAPQIGRKQRLIVLDLTGSGCREGLMCLINPELTPIEEAGTVIGEEGCLSVPLKYRSKVERAARVRLKATGLDGRPLDLIADDILAVCLQHEVDHLNGKLFLDHISRLKRTLYNARINKRAHRQADKAD
ncbi:MAG: peptide deformylase [Deltaproteobacteria bacterium]|jgi:peptide deformylase|nr:peptide deformylase [Deltaproteobacteria bacterium]